MMPAAVVLNLFYTGLGIARSLGAKGVKVYGLTARPRVYGNSTRFAEVILAPDSRENPKALLEFMLQLGRTLGHRAVVFPTRDDDVVFLDRFRQALEPHYILTVPESGVLESCLNKWETFVNAQRAKVQTPESWKIETLEDLRSVARQVTYPCVLKPLSAHHWRKSGNWQIVGGRKAIALATPEELIAEYEAIQHADPRALVQEMIQGNDQCLIITACYLDRNSQWIAGFNTQKILQTPEGFGTGCIVQTTYRPELFEPTLRLLQTMRFTGIAEVEYKWNASKAEFQLIEVNPRPWDQHRLGTACGVDLIYLAYCEHAGLPLPAYHQETNRTYKWIAEDALLLGFLQSVWRGDRKVLSWFRLLRGKRIYAIWAASDPLPWLAYLVSNLPAVGRMGVAALWTALGRRRKEAAVYDKSLVENKDGG